MWFNKTYYIDYLCKFILETLIAFIDIQKLGKLCLITFGIKLFALFMEN